MADEDRLIKALEELGVDGESYRVLALLPLVLVAWADGKMQPREVKRLLDVARRKDFLPPSAVTVLEGWIAEQPSKEYADRALRALVELARRERGVGADLSAQDLRKLTSLSFDIASAAGGLWGDVLSVSSEEEQVIESLAEVLHIDDGQSWKELLEDLE